MPCDHLQPDDVVELAEKWLRDRGIREWSGARVRHGENTPGGTWASVVLELERRDGAWVVTEIARNKEPLQQSECGLEVRIADRG